MAESSNKSSGTSPPFPPETLAGLGEQEVLRRLQRFCPPAGIGDDGAAVLWRSPAPTQDHLVVTTDVLGVGDCVNEFQIYDFDCLDFLPDTGCTK